MEHRKGNRVVLNFEEFSTQVFKWENIGFSTESAVVDETNVTVDSIFEAFNAANDCYLEFGQRIIEMAENYNSVIQAFKVIDDAQKGKMSEER